MTLLLALLLLAPAGAAHHGAALFLESQAALLTGDLDKAGELALASVKADPASPTLRVALAEIQVQQGAIQGAKASLAEALRMDPDHAEALGLLGVLAAMQGSLNEAEGLLRRAHAVQGDEESALRLAGLLGEMGRDGEAEVVLSPWDGPSALRGLARLRLARDDYAGAAEPLRRVLDYAPGDPETLITLSRALEETGDWAGAAQAAEQAGAYKVSRGGALRQASLLRRSGECPRALEVLDDQGLDTPQADEERTQCPHPAGTVGGGPGGPGPAPGGGPRRLFPPLPPPAPRYHGGEGGGGAGGAGRPGTERPGRIGGGAVGPGTGPSGPPGGAKRPCGARPPASPGRPPKPSTTPP
jgi:tetratricopeptide (TPR) repeat protein